VWWVARPISEKSIFEHKMGTEFSVVEVLIECTGIFFRKIGYSRYAVPLEMLSNKINLISKE
jgi:hypothetical protein